MHRIRELALHRRAHHSEQPIDHPDHLIDVVRLCEQPVLRELLEVGSHLGHGAIAFAPEEAQVLGKLLGVVVLQRVLHVFTEQFHRARAFGRPRRRPNSTAPGACTKLRALTLSLRPPLEPARGPTWSLDRATPRNVLGFIVVESRCHRAWCHWPHSVTALTPRLRSRRCPQGRWPLQRRWPESSWPPSSPSAGEAPRASRPPAQPPASEAAPPHPSPPRRRPTAPPRPQRPPWAAQSAAVGPGEAARSPPPPRPAGCQTDRGHRRHHSCRAMAAQAARPLPWRPRQRVQRAAAAAATPEERWLAWPLVAVAARAAVRQVPKSARGSAWSLPCEPRRWTSTPRVRAMRCPAAPGCRAGDPAAADERASLRRRRLLTTRLAPSGWARTAV